MGDICNNFKPKAEGYSASVSYSTIMGDITIN